jgi:predicted RNA binding protein YcfA (HicA-like mRNA interferase family)
MRALPALSGRAVIAALERAGFEVIRTKGSHQFLRHRDDPSRQTVVPVIGTIYNPAHFARFCGKRASAAPTCATL